ncbi:MAG: GTPase HflX, partial [Bombilactobacillus sp.]|nr:GTPase HflX [Bombilactobacillus sp.]
KLLANLITKRVFANYQQVNLLLPLSAGKPLADLHENAQIIAENYRADGVHITARLAPEKQQQFQNYII